MAEFDWSLPKITIIEPPNYFIEELQTRVFYALRVLVTPTIKGDITKGKLRWRGIKRLSTFIYGDWAYEFFLQDDGTFKYRQIGRPLEPHPHKVWPIIRQRTNRIDLDFENDAEVGAAYGFWKMKNKTITFGTTSRDRRMYRNSGIIEQITRKEWEISW